MRATVDRPARRRRPPSTLRRLVMAAAGLLLLALALPNIGPARRAARAEGTPGAFIAETLRCTQHPGHEACTWYGTFQPDDDEGGAARTTSLYGGRHGLDEGDTTRAVDTGRPGRVYPPSGSHEWIAVALTLIAGIALLVPAVLSLIPSSHARDQRQKGVP